MATIVMLPARRQGLPALSEQEGGAKILFFTGVRYEREIEPEPEVPCEALGSENVGEADVARLAV